MSNIKYYVERSCDDIGNRAFTPGIPQVIKVRVEAGVYGSSARLHVLEPKEIKDKWPTLSELYWKEVSETTPGPITEDKWRELVR